MSSRIRLQTSHPLISGIITSSTTKSGKPIARELERLFAVLRDDDVELRALELAQMFGDEIAHRRFVVRDEHQQVVI